MSLPALLRLDALATSRRALVRAAAPLAALAAFAGASLQEGGAVAKFAAGVSTAFPVASILGLVLGASSFSGDAANSALRAVLARPTSRVAVIFSRAFVLFGSQVVVGVVAILAAYATARAFGPVRGVFLGEGAAALELVTSDELVSEALRSTLLALPALLVAPVFGIFASAWIDDVGGATALAALVAFGPPALALAGYETPAWWFAAPASAALSVLSDLAEGVRTRQATIEGGAFLLRAILLPFLYGVWAFVFGALRFRARDFRE
jgi:ABC-type transport system involved in multi-copper enzyme maturation permease subunit